MKTKPDIRHLLDDPVEMVEAALDARQAQMWTALPVKIVSYDPKTMTAKATALIKATVRNPDGKIEKVELPQLEDIPVHFPSGGGATLTFPVKEGDEAMMVVHSRSIDQWHQSGKVEQQIASRMHDLSDGTLHVGLRSKPKVPKNVSATSTQLRVDDDEGNAKHFVDYSKDGGITTSVDDGKHVTTISPTTGITHKSSVKVNIEAPESEFKIAKLKVEGTVEHTGDYAQTGNYTTTGTVSGSNIVDT